MKRNARQYAVVSQTSAEHDAIAGHFLGFERTLAGAAPVSVAADRQRIRRELEPLLVCLADHLSSAESSGGLLAEIEVALGRNHDVSTARRLHRSAAEQATVLSRTLEDAGAETSADDLASMTRRLGSAILRHREVEANLILAAFDQDIGAGD